MLGFLTRRAPRTNGRVRYPVHLGVEPLERRDVPSALTINISYGSTRMVTVYGVLSDVPNVANQPVTITGKVQGTTATDSLGDYSLTEVADGTGVVTASSNGASANTSITDLAPVINTFQATEGTGDMWTFSGTVTYRSPQGLSVVLGGAPVSVPGNSAPVRADGTFSVCIQLNGTPSDNGLVWARTTSPYGLVSNTAYDDVVQTGV
jgi:hypothetical protein